MKSDCRLIRAETLLLALTLPVLGIASGVAEAQPTGRCVSAVVPEMIVLPDGSRHEPGGIRICLNRKHSPVAGMHEIRVNGHGKGLFLSRLDDSEALTEAFLSFRRASSGELILEGYAVPNGEVMAVYRMERIPRRRDRAQLLVKDSTKLPEPNAEPLLLLAAVSN